MNFIKQLIIDDKRRHENSALPCNHLLYSWIYYKLSSEHNIKEIDELVKTHLPFEKYQEINQYVTTYILMNGKFNPDYCVDSFTKPNHKTYKEYLFENENNSKFIKVECILYMYYSNDIDLNVLLNIKSSEITFMEDIVNYFIDIITKIYYNTSRSSYIDLINNSKF